jgi:hypothetical protein
LKFKNIVNLPDKQFRRITGIKRQTFEKIVELLKESTAQTGRPHKLSLEDRVLMTLEYLREYRTYAHIAASYGLSETRTFENIRQIENVLIKSKEFSLPGKKALLKSEYEFEVVLIDATETPIDRPKKNSAGSIQERKKSIPSKLSS